MKRFFAVVLSVSLLSGCATYKFQKGSYPYDSGYVVSRDKRIIPEYTLGPENSVPQDLTLAKRRFKRRRGKVESYYKKMGYIESRAKEVFWNPPALFVDFIWGLFRLPFVIAKSRKYDKDSVYRQRIDQQEEQKFAAEGEVRKRYKEELALFVKKDLENKEGIVVAGVAAPAAVPQPQPETIPAAPAASLQLPPPQASSLPPAPQVQPEKAVTPTQMTQELVKEEKQPLEKIEPKPAPPAAKAAPIKKAKEKKVVVLHPPVAVITARPQKGYSPLRVQFSGGKSHAPSGRIIAYEWDFGDGDTSIKKNPVNTYWSTTYGIKSFEVKLTVTDNNGNSSVTTAVINAITK